MTTEHARSGRAGRAAQEVFAAKDAQHAAPRFFSTAEAACAQALLNLLTGQAEGDDEAGATLLEMVDARLGTGDTEEWRLAGMPEDGQAWRDTLAYLDADADRRYGTSFADAKEESQETLVQAVRDLADGDWHGLPAAQVLSLWTTYACAALYAHAPA